MMRGDITPSELTVVNVKNYTESIDKVYRLN